jgi:DNA-directed RNA polymerase II subunit RPB2
LPSSDDKYESKAEIKSSSMEEFQPARTTKLQLETSGMITLRLGQDTPFINVTEEGRDVPLFIMFRLLGIESDKDILECICYNLDNELSKKMVELLKPSINDPIIIEQQIYDQQTAIHYLEQERLN